MDLGSWIFFGSLAVVCAALRWRFSLRRRMDTRMHEAPREEREALADIQRDIDRGKAARQGVF
ncbi:hypothetical protein [Schaalia hyovaginalis]|uniref:hypothetical protein n=1 Tax=Schaalia hyovaginalis TaxID=29316 RepID=UPI0026F2DF17|nr:hypothetical protein [Schaalia hyovaginalis]MCI6411856.1 hypothetical protein [Schaalia hyovaginalis]